jgi:Right handed beta helix region
MHHRCGVAFARRATWKFLLGGLLLLGAAVACAVSDALTGPHTAAIRLQYNGATAIVVGARVPFTVTADIDGTTIEASRFRYTIEDSSIISRTAVGDTLVARLRGRTRLAVSLESPLLPDPPSLSVTLDAVVAAVQVSPPIDTLTSLEDTLILDAPAFDINGAPIAGVSPLWTSSDTAIASFVAAGRLVGHGNGQVLVRALVDNDTGMASVVVAQRLARLQMSPAGLQLTALTAESTVAAIGVDARGHPLAGVPVSWTSDAPSIVTVTTDGRVRAVDNGVTRLWAQSGSVRDSLSVIVEQRARRVVILPDPAPPIVALGDQISLTAGATDSLGFVVAVPNKTSGWATLDPTVAIVDRNGLVTGVGVGTGRVVAVMDAARDTMHVTVGDVPASIELQPALATLASLKDTLLLSASVRNSRGNLIQNPVILWRASDSAIARVDTLPRPLAVAVGVGTVRIIAVAGPVADTSLVTVTNAPVFFDITQSADTLTSTWDSLPVPIVILNARGDTVPKSSVQWSSDRPLVGSVTATGLVVARDTGDIVVRAKYGVAPGDTLRDSIAIRLLNLPASVVLSDDRDTLTAVGQSIAYAGAVRNARGNPISGYTITWASTNAAVVNVSAGGVATATGFGSAFVIGQAGGMADTIVTVVRNPTRLVVDNGVTITPRLGTLKRPYARIQDGVNAADLDDTVFVRRGTAPYAETVALTRRATLLGDDSAFAATLPRNPLLLPLLSHDSGTAAITAYTAATVIVKNLAVRHTVAGDAIDARGTDLRVSGFYVNPPGTAAGRVGRGIALDSATSATARITSSEIRSVRGYGIRVRDGAGVLIDTVLVETVDSMAGVDVGAGIRILRGSSHVVRHATVRGTQGPAILVDSSAGPTIAMNDLAGRQRLVLVRSSNGATIQNNLFDTSPLGLNGEVVSGGTLFEWAAAEIDSSWQAVVSGNSFRDVAQEPFNAMRLVNARNPSFPSQAGAQLSANAVVGNRAGVRSENSNLNIQNSRFDSTTTGIVGTGSDVLTLQGDTIRATQQDACVRATSASTVTLTASVFQRCTAGAAHAVAVSGGFFRVQQSTFLENRAAVAFTGVTFTATGNTVSGSGFTPAQGDTLVAVAALQATASLVAIVQNTVAGHRLNAGVRAEGGSFSARIDSNFISTNATGVLLGSLSNFSARDNDIFDNLTAGARNEVSATVNLPQTWWGDPRGPRGAADASATGDTVIGNVNSGSWTVIPHAAGTVGVEARTVRGDGQTAPRGTILPNAFTVRVVDAAGRPVAGVSVTFKVTAGGGSFAGTGQLKVNTNASGLAEAIFTLGASAGVNTVTATGPSLNTLIITATGT